MFELKTRILVVDDMKAMRKMIMNMIKDLGFSELSEAEDGNVAWEVISKNDPAIQVVISDWNMPNCTGLDLLKKVRADKRFTNLPFLMVTAEAEGRQVATAVAAGVDGYVVKPFAQAGLSEKLEILYQKTAGKK